MKRNKQNKEKKVDDLDTETTFADMNVEGFHWYNPSKKSGADKQDLHLSKKEKRAIQKAYFLAYLPFIIGVCLIALCLFGFAYLWLM